MSTCDREDERPFTKVTDQAARPRRRLAKGDAFLIGRAEKFGAERLITEPHFA